MRAREGGRERERERDGEIERGRVIAVVRAKIYIHVVLGRGGEVCMFVFVFCLWGRGGGL